MAGHPVRSVKQRTLRRHPCLTARTIEADDVINAVHSCYEVNTELRHDFPVTKVSLQRLSSLCSEQFHLARYRVRTIALLWRVRSNAR